MEEIVSQQDDAAAKVRLERFLTGFPVFDEAAYARAQVQKLAAGGEVEVPLSFFEGISETVVLIKAHVHGEPLSFETIAAENHGELRADMTDGAMLHRPGLIEEDRSDMLTDCSD